MVLFRVAKDVVFWIAKDVAPTIQAATTDKIAKRILMSSIRVGVIEEFFALMLLSRLFN